MRVLAIGGDGRKPLAPEVLDGFLRLLLAVVHARVLLAPRLPLDVHPPAFAPVAVDGVAARAELVPE